MPVNQHLVISVCNFLIPEVAQIIKTGDYADVILLGYASSCSERSVKTSNMLEKISEKSINNSDILLICSNCFSPDHVENKNIKVKKLENCFELVSNRDTVLHYISKGFYVVTNGWLRTYKTSIKEWGFEEDTAKTFFRESMKGILLLDTKIPGDYLSDLRSLSEYMGLDYEILPVGLSHCKNIIDAEIFKWRAENERRSMNEKISVISRQFSDYSVIFNQLEILVNLTEESSIIQQGFELLNILFAPSEIYFNKGLNPTDEQFEFKGVFKRKERVKNDNFQIEVYHLNEHLGTFNIIGIQFPQYIDEYKKMSLLISQIFGLSIANARKYKLSLDQNEKIKDFSHELQRVNITKDKFFSIIAHDLKAPFSSLLGFSNLLISEISLLIREPHNERVSKIEKYSSIIHQTSNNAYTLLTNLLEWSLSQTGSMKYNPQVILLSNLTNEISGLLNTQAKIKNITIIDNIAHDLKVFADKNMLMAIIRNLIGNAIKYTPENGVIYLSAGIQKDGVKISITDSGCGISKENLDKLFLIEYANSTPGTNKEGGTGLGLILCKEFVEKHNGSIWADSEVGKGSSFHFIIPINNNTD